MIKCTRCNRSFDESMFYMDRGKRRTVCKLCHRDQRVKYYTENEREHRIQRYRSDVRVNIRQRLKTSKGNFSEKTITKILRKYAKKIEAGTLECPLCGELLMIDNYSIDHIKPQVKGGFDTIENIQITCKKCNLGKGKMHNSEYINHCKRVTKHWSRIATWADKEAPDDE